MDATKPPRAYPGMPHEELLNLIRWQEDNGTTPTRVYRPYARQFEQDFYAAVRAAVEADPLMRHHRMSDGAFNSPMVYFADTEGQSGYVVYVGVEHRNEIELTKLRTFINAWYFYGSPDDEQREDLIDTTYFTTHNAGLLADLFLGMVRDHRAKLDASADS